MGIKPWHQSMCSLLRRRLLPRKQQPCRRRALPPPAMPCSQYVLRHKAAGLFSRLVGVTRSWHLLSGGLLASRSLLLLLSLSALLLSGLQGVCGR